MDHFSPILDGARRACAIAVMALGISGGAGERPNVLFIISDDLTANALGCYGNPRAKTPNIDRLSARGVRFDHAYCQFPVCGPARASLMSGLYPQMTGVTGNGKSGQLTQNLNGRPTLPEWFRQHGWHTARTSKIYHMRVPGDITAGVDGPDHAPSWTERHNFKSPEWMTIGWHEHLTNEKLRRTPDVHYSLGFGGAFYVVKGVGDGAEQADYRAARKACDIMRQRREAPFFLAVGLVRPHVPLVAPEAFFEACPVEAMRLARRLDGDWEDIPQAGISKNSKGNGLDGRPDAQKKVLSAYYAATSFMDAQVGVLMDSLEALDLLDRTIVVFTSDHGYHLGEHDFWQKMSLHEESARVPLIIAAPNVKPSISGSVVEALDIYPTLAELAGLPIPSHCQGASLTAILSDRTAAVREDSYTFHGRGHLLRTPRWAYMEYSQGGVELYDMSADPGQFSNLAMNPAYAPVVARFRERLRARLREIEAGH